MLRRRLLFALVLCLSAPALFASTVSRESEPRVLVLGDSISAGYGVPDGAGWVALLSRALGPRGILVVKASISGETTEGGKARLPALLAEHRPAVLVLELGGNDGLRGFPLAVTRTNLETMIRAARSAGTRVLLAGMRIPPNYGPRYTEGFHALYGELSTAHDTALVPFILEGIAGVPGLMQDDGIHPKAEAQPAILALVMPALEPLLRR
ncbi:MAG: arylesterase [Gammaproteobacteria bacterium]